MTRPEFRGFTEALQKIMDGDAALPNFKELDLAKGVAAIAAAGGSTAQPGVFRARAGFDPHPEWARYILHKTPSGEYDGSGYVMLYGGGTGRIGSFAICEHEKVVGPNANPSRGWNPGYCGLCGLNLSVDSGD